ncbi:4ff4146e-31a3-4091-854b-1c01da238183 [Thermothielavioides terrestris]|uniref:Uncharacterized protein n=2 Tax=Thermothielavioides terrestris TaxID=2587410 RepID=G2QVA8_THETT|nr:uncharacterized protein THITE_157712 [Thermothielavioides terrestris NRRL 8126]AEO63795.1 hypothetical protein THITE_157712 [Thermothielavioides terrestris NRRL 8126]SPQ23477.1 4ff4146e-31a3-4091-854b-1c01da238183 [Thermothielavioides terrestris]
MSAPFFNTAPDTDLSPPVTGYYPRLPTVGGGLWTVPLPGIRCPTCAANGEEVWVVPGLICPKCRSPAPAEEREEDQVD